MHRCRTVAALAAAGTLLLAGCGGGGSSGRSNTTNNSGTSSASTDAAGGGPPAAVDVAALYQAAVRRADDATCRFNKAVAVLGPRPKVRETKDLVPPVAAALRRFRKDLGDIRWPAAAKRDAANLQQATEPVVADIEALPDQSPTSMPSWTAKIQKDKAALASATRALRADIGLLPLAAETCS